MVHTGKRSCNPAGTNWLDVADLNFASQDMRKAMISAMRYWVFDANIDGYRCDAADMVPFDFWKQANDSLNNIPGRKIIMLAEGARSDHFSAGFQMNYSWDFYGKLKSVFSGQPASGLSATHASEYSSIPAGKHKLRFTTNHDESAWDATPMTLFNGKQGALAASVIATFMGGVPMIYGSQEVGRLETLPFFTNSPVNWTQNPDMLIEYQKIMTFYSGSETTKKGTLVSYPNNDICAFIRRSETEELVCDGECEKQRGYLYLTGSHWNACMGKCVDRLHCWGGRFNSSGSLRIFNPDQGSMMHIWLHFWI
ncbi:MAG: hypothetical protein IPH20_19685 [Bacteroidales bacterium]|nr:hypothetical protein [Bacteroidales bacterium]